MNIDYLIALYVRKRDRLDELAAEHKARTAEIMEEMQLIEAGLQKLMEDQGVRQFKSAHGTAYQQAWTKASVADWEEALGYIRSNERWDLLTRAVNKTVALEIGEVPGVAVTRGIKVNVRRS